MTEDFERRNIGNFEFNLVKHNRKTPSILRDAQDNIWVYVNETYSDSDVEIFIQRNSVQIAKLMEPKMKLSFEDKEIVDREEFMFLGNSYQLIVTDQLEVEFEFRDNRFYLRQDSVHYGKELFKDFYVSKANQRIKDKKEEFQKIIGKEAKSVVLADLQGKWGLCTPTGIIKINWRAVMLPERLFDYVLAHEHAHLAHLNHSASFWYSLDTLIDKSKLLDRELENYLIE